MSLNVNAPEFRPSWKDRAQTQQQELYAQRIQEDAKQAKDDCEWIFSDDLSSIAQNSSTHGGNDDKEHLNCSS